MSAINIMGSFQDPKNLDEGASRLLNVRVVPRAPQEGKPAAVRLVGSPGLVTMCRPTTSPCIVIAHALGTVWSGHADGSIYRNVETPAPVFAGTVAVRADAPLIRFAEDRTALAIASNRNVLNSALAGTGYTATIGGGVVNAGLDASIEFDPSAVVELDNITVWGAASNVYANQSDKMYSSVPLAPANVLANAFATKEARADRIVDMAISGRVLWPLGARSLEQWYNAGGTVDFPFTAYPNSLISVGLAARRSLAILRDVIAFVGTDKRIWTCTGQSGQPVSPPWVDLLLQQLTVAEIDSLTGYAYGQGGSDFYVLTLPGQWSLELAAATRTWSYRQSPESDVHAGRCATEHDGGTTFVGLDTGHVCTVDLNASSEPSGTLYREIVTPWVGSEEKRQTYNSIDVTSSMGPSTGTFLLDWSDTNPQPGQPRVWRGLREITMPEPGVRRAIARNLGSGRRRQFRLRYSGVSAPFTIDEFFADVTAGT